VLNASTAGGGGGIAVLSPSDVWAVGSGGGQPLVEHWDGSTWSLVPTPTFGNGGLFHKIAAIEPDDMWAVGFANAQQQALAEHWDGTAWSLPPAPTMSKTILLGVHALSSTAAWAVGDDGIGAVMVHWDGTNWSFASVPSGRYILYDVRAFSDTDIWVVGVGFQPALGLPEPQPATALAFHFDGTNWTIHADATPPGGESYLFHLFGTATNDLWAVSPPSST
jgi:hypothetical protein